MLTSEVPTKIHKLDFVLFVEKHSQNYLGEGDEEAKNKN
jgi:hypothetical protein